MGFLSDKVFQAGQVVKPTLPTSPKLPSFTNPSPKSQPNAIAQIINRSNATAETPMKVPAGWALSTPRPTPAKNFTLGSSKIAVPPRRLAMGAPVLVNPYANPNALTVSGLSNSAIAAAGGGSFSSADYASEVQEEPETVSPVSQEYKDYLKGKVVPLVLIVLALVVVGYLIFKKPWKKAA